MNDDPATTHQINPVVAAESETASETAPLTEEETLVLPVADELEADPIPEIDPESIVEAAEQLLREAVPHDYDVLVIGAGPGGYVAAIRAAQLGARVGLVEEREIGGVCLNRGCIPTKTLLESVDVLRLMRRASEYGITVEGSFRPDFTAMNVRRHEVIQQLRDNVSHLLEANGVSIILGRARFVEGHSVEITDAAGATRRVLAVNVIIATGSLPQRLPIPGNDLPGVLTSDELLQQNTLPKHLLVVGGGAVGVEFAYLYRELGTRATLLEMSPAILPQEDKDISQEMTRLLQARGVNIVAGAKLKEIKQHGENLDIIYTQDEQEQTITAEQVLLAAGRRANTEGLRLDTVGIKQEKGKILVDESCETNVGGVYAIGDCVRDFGWAHLASAEGKMVAERITSHDTQIDLKHVPSCYYTHPEIASVGQTEAQAKQGGIATRVGVFHFRANGKAASAGDHDGFVKVVVDDATDKLLGCQIIGPRATDLINEAVLALKTGQTVEEMVGAIHAHPTFSEALPEAALMARHQQQMAD
ncbi:MAG: dihydrolipoyl dehydrogenase [Abitibacteriaceae bacterium]|nr:dihydrolipoyl dehydrogenase [Abditibacteriaceae bacterium]